MAPLSLDQQQRLILARFPKTKPWSRTIRGISYLCFELRLRPTETSASYSVLFAYGLGRRPLVWVIDPEPVTEAHGVRTPHLNSDGTLCLFDPDKGEWDGTQVLAYTMVPWTLRWLFHYEHWLVFGDWRGDESVEIQGKPPNAMTISREEAA
jgi:hypothetical protein